MYIDVSKKKKKCLTSSDTLIQVIIRSQPILTCVYMAENHVFEFKLPIPTLPSYVCLLKLRQVHKMLHSQHSDIDFNTSVKEGRSSLQKHFFFLNSK